MKKFLKRNKRTCILFICLFVTLIVLFFLSVSDVIKSDQVSNFIVGAIGPFFGAYFAFDLIEKKDLAKQDNERIKVLNLAMLVIVRKCDAVAGVRRLVLPSQNHLHRAINLPSFQVPQYSDLCFNFEELSFLFEFRKAEVMSKLNRVQLLFQQTFVALNQRNDFFEKEVRPKLQGVFKNGSEVTVEDVILVLGKTTYDKAVFNANQLYDLVDGSYSALLDAHDVLFATAKEAFPSAGFLRRIEV